MDSHEVRRRWAERSGEYSPRYYAYRGPDWTSDVILELLERFVDRRAPILELGCSSGRHLSHLLDNGFDDVAGIEVNDDAFDVMADAYPDLAAEGEFYADAIEDVVEEFDDDRFEAIFTVETLQHVHPDSEWIFDELSRITSDLLVTAENEGDGDRARASDPPVSHVDDEFPLYHRDWNAIFTERGFAEIEARTGRRDTVRAFRPTPDRNDR